MLKQQWDIDELIAHFTFVPPEIAWLGENADHNHLGKATALKWFQHEGRFPERSADIPPAIVVHIAQQLGLPPAALSRYDGHGRRARAHKRAFRALYGFRRATRTDQVALRTWLVAEVLPHEHRPLYLEQLVEQRLHQRHIEPPTQGQLARLASVSQDLPRATRRSTERR
ncbi:MAG: DUF4158 domain-containing protein [Chloroflexi bacterium AL-N10]|nr:DUF4158 domain-containing protein [Chloroflexi bacterium AL-N1]NOK69607.1 DUF4158 domain-containing protein [Chloroflexi bacterium AL-N10]NOK72154.1 DUF4158 domain-containing protein [Chloroflexi bacterium AL-N5]